MAKKKKPTRGKKQNRSRKKSGRVAGSQARGPRPEDSATFTRLGYRGGNGFRVPAIVVVPVCAGVGWFVAGWPGAIFCGAVGIFLWRMRA